jgi:hypothetical protein
MRFERCPGTNWGIRFCRAPKGPCQRRERFGAAPIYSGQLQKPAKSTRIRPGLVHHSAAQAGLLWRVLSLAVRSRRCLRRGATARPNHWKDRQLTCDINQLKPSPRSMSSLPIQQLVREFWQSNLGCPMIFPLYWSGPRHVRGVAREELGLSNDRTEAHIPNPHGCRGIVKRHQQPRRRYQCPKLGERANSGKRRMKSITVADSRSCPNRARNRASLVRRSSRQLSGRSRFI